MYSWSNVFWCLFGCVLGVLISTVMDYSYVARAIQREAQCHAQLLDPDHCAAYCNDAWRDYYGC